MSKVVKISVVSCQLLEAINQLNGFQGTVKQYSNLIVLSIRTITQLTIWISNYLKK